ncbi:MAG: single-stranded-DNA-specific exonuclease RecJ [bacterium]
MYEWVLRAADSDLCASLASSWNVSAQAAHILYHRGLRTSEDGARFLATSLKGMRSPFLLRSMEQAVERVMRAVLRRERVLVYGDYDVDGITATAILVHFLRYAGLQPFYYVPDRLSEGYGFHPEWVRRFHNEGVQLIITVDCGVSAHEAVGLAQSLGIDVVVTDHHECQGRIPPALAVVNPKQPREGFPFRDLAGVGVAFYLVVALRTRLRECGLWERKPEPVLRDYLDLVALGTLADMVPLQQENRLFVKHGLGEISAARRPGVSVLKEQSGIRGHVFHARPIVYRMIPRINAPGRLGSALEGLEMLLCEDLEQAKRMARGIEDRNHQRKSIEEAVYQEAFRLAEKHLGIAEQPVLVLGSEKWHKGILGIVASRLVEDFQRPVVLLSFDGDLGKGSVRTVEGLDILAALLSCREHLEEFGGHRSAAGIRLQRRHMERFRRAFAEAIQALRGRGKIRAHRLLLDLWLKEPKQLNERIVAELGQMAPFGSGNDEPVFGMERVSFFDCRAVGENHLRLSVGDPACRFEAIGFGMANGPLTRQAGCTWDIAFTPEQDEWQGKSQMRLRLVDIRPSGSPPPAPCCITGEPETV